VFSKPFGLDVRVFTRMGIAEEWLDAKTSCDQAGKIMIRCLGLIVLSFCLHAVEVPATVVRIVDGDTVETSAGTVRLLWIDTPESRGNSHGPAMPEGKAATAFLEGKLAKDAKLTLWGPGDT
jgi:endonuclease YncB( thermonuclease family)